MRGARSESIRARRPSRGVAIRFFAIALLASPIAPVAALAVIDELFVHALQSPCDTASICPCLFQAQIPARAAPCRRLQVPVPPRGYWARVAAGQRLSRPPLPSLPPGQAEESLIRALQPAGTE